MKTFISFSIAFLAAFVVAEPRFHHVDPLEMENGRVKRDEVGCQDSYGPDSLVCGNASSPYCYNPTNGESCCLLDGSYCAAGQFCAPVAGYCCNTGEDLSSCAKRQGFSLPPSTSTPILVPIPATSDPVSTPPVPLPDSAIPEPTSTPAPVVSLHHISLPPLSVPPINLFFSSTKEPAPVSVPPKDLIFSSTVDTTSMSSVRTSTPDLRPTVIDPTSKTTVKEIKTTFSPCSTDASSVPSMLYNGTTLVTSLRPLFTSAAAGSSSGGVSVVVVVVGVMGVVVGGLVEL